MTVDLNEFLSLETAIYPREAILRVSYWMAEDAEISLSQPHDNTMQVMLRPKSGGDARALREKFEAALIDFSIRVDVERNTRDLRNRIWQIAFTEAGSQDAERN